MLLQRGVRRPWIVRSLMSAFCARPGLFDLMVSVSGDYVPVRELARPSVWWNASARTAERARPSPA
jgi:hypothetical protein